MAQFDKSEYKFPDEEDAPKAKDAESEEDEFVIEIEDATPPEDRGHKPMPKEIVAQIEDDELDEYSGKAKERMLQMKKVWHDERRAKESAQREQEEAIRLAQHVLEENKRLKATMVTGEKEYISTMQYAADTDLEMAKRKHREAYESGDPDSIAEAHQALTEATLRLDRVKNFKPTVQNDENDVKLAQIQQPAPKQAPVDPKYVDWRERNDSWFQKDKEMTQSALGLHEKLADQYGLDYVGTDDYYKRIDATMRKRFPEAFPNDASDDNSAESRPQRKTTTVVASAKRSTAPKQVKLSTDVMVLIKKLKITPEQYVKEFLKLEK